MHRLLFLLPAGVYGAAHGDCPSGRANADDKGVCPAGYEMDAAGTNAPATQAATTAAAVVATTAAATAAATTAAATTAAATTAAPTTAAPTTAAPANATNATNGTNGTNSSRRLEDEDFFFVRPIKRNLGLHTLCACKQATTTIATNSSNTTIPEAKVEITTVMTIQLDISGMNTAQKTATGNSLAFGLHAASCNGVASMWTTMVQCMMGQGTAGSGVTFGVDMAIDALLGTATYGCTSATDCYGGAAPTRQLAAVELSNSAKFEVTAKGANAAQLANTAKASLDTAAAGDTFTPTAILAEVQKAMTRPAMNATLGSYVAALETAVAAATVQATVSEVVGATVAPSSTSNAFMAGVSSVFFLIAGALLM